MAKFMVKKSELKNICKAVDDRKLAELKKEIIEILKKQDGKEFKKAIDYLESQELHFTHLEKSITGKWVEKAGYGIGTVRVWKGKKYKKIAPDKWVRVFDKEGRGTNIAIGKLIAKVQKIDNVEDLMAFVMANKQRFVDENGVDLPVLDKLRAAVDARNGNVGNKGTSKIENTTLKYDDIGKIKEVESTLIEPSKTARNFKYNKDKLSIDELKDAKNEIDSYIQKLNKEISSLEKIKKENADKLTDNAKANIDGNIAYSKNIINAYTKDKEDCEKLLEEKKNKSAEKKTVQGVKILSKDEIHNLTKGEVQDYRKELHDAMKKLDYGADDFDILYATKKIADDTWHNKEYKDAVDSDKNIKEFAAFLKENNLHQHDKIEYKGKEYIVQYDSQGGDGDLLWIPPVFDDSEFDVSKIKIKTEESEEEKPAEKEEKPVEETKETQKEEKTEKVYTVDNSDKAVSFDELQPIASNKSVGENEVQLPYSKDLANEIESLKDCVVPKWDSREFMKHVYYEDGKLITTDARRMKFIEVGELEGIPDGSYVDITTDKSGINIKKLEGMDSYKFPNYKRVIPEDLNQKATLDTKLVKNKIKEMQKDGAISRKGTNVVQLEFRDGKVFIDDTPVGEAKNISMKYSDDWGPARNETNFMAINADYLVNALSGKTSVLQIGERADKAVMINTGSSSNILMPMSGSDKKMDYGQGRQAKKDANEKKSALKEAYKKTNEEYIASIKANYGERFKRMAQSAADNLTERMADMSDETLKLNYDRLKFNLDKVMDKKEYITEDTKVDNKLKLGLRDAILYQTTAKEHPEVIERFEEELEKRGISVKKSLFDDFVMDMFVDEDEEEIEEDKENESLFNDYSAEQPELFNSTELMVSEAMNRHFCNCL